MPERRHKIRQAASPEEAAAIVAAVEQFLRDHTPPPAVVDQRPSGWLRAALLEGTGREPDAPSPWGGTSR